MKSASTKPGMRSLVLKVFACLFWIFGTFRYARSHFYRDPGSVFFDKARAYEQRYSQYYKSEAGRYIDSSHGSELQIVQPKSDSNARLCVSLARFEESVHSILRYAMCALDGKGCRTDWAACARFRSPKPRRIARRSS
jgi:hypothetical protein